MRQRFFSVNITFHDAILVDTNGGQNVQDIFITRVDTVKDQADDDLLPSRASFVPEFGFLEVDDLTDVLHGTVQGTRGKGLVFVVVGDGDQQLGVAVVHGRTKVVTIVQGELVGIASGSSVFIERQLQTPGNTSLCCLVR